MTDWSPDRLYWCSSFSVISCCRGLQVSIPQEVYRAANGEDATMTCSFAPARPISDIFILKWEAYPINDEEDVVRINKSDVFFEC